MKYKVGDRVKIKGLDWYNKNKGNADKTNSVWCEDGSTWFFHHMSQHCGKIMTIKNVWTYSYTLEGSDSRWTDEMIEGLVEEGFGSALNPIEMKSNANCLSRERADELATKIDKKLPSGNQNVWELPDGYQFKDENGNVINAKKIVLEKRKKEYPKTRAECIDALEYKGHEGGYKWELLNRLQDLIICRDAYWKIAGEEMGWGKPWEPDWENEEDWIHCITTDCGEIYCTGFRGGNKILAFPPQKCAMHSMRILRKK